ncbi:hypothetical protein TI03_00360 [Achromatium sp. WMS1]|nr:hypothetical protein TI03_00360 [Achromatium sp. WMS1]
MYTNVLSPLFTSSDLSKATSICQLTHTREELIASLKAIQDSTNLTDKQKVNTGKTLATNLLRSLQDSKTLYHSHCDSLKKLIFAYTVARWCDSGHSCNSEQQTLTKTIQVTTTPNETIFSKDISKLVGCSDPKQVDNACILQVINSRQSGNSHSQPATSSTTAPTEDTAAAATLTPTCPFPQPQDQLKATDQWQNIKRWIQAAVASQGIKSGQLHNEQKKFLEATLRIQDHNQIKWEELIDALSQYIIAINCNTDTANNCSDVMISGVLDEFTEARLKELNNKLPSQCQIPEDQIKQHATELAKKQNADLAKSRDFRATILLHHIQNDPPSAPLK